MTTTALRREPRAPDRGAPAADGWGGPGTVTLTPRRARPVERPTRPDGPALAARPPAPTVPGPIPEVRPRRARPVRGVLLVFWLALLLGVPAATSSAGPPRTSAPLPSPVGWSDAPAPAAPSPAAAIDGLVGSGSAGHVSIAALDLATGRSFGYASDVPVHTASVVKLDVLETVLLQAHDAGRKLTPDTVTLATQMMENSDNDAATRLWNVVGGGEALARANVRLGVRSTQLDDEHWGDSTTCAADQVALLGALVGPGPLGAGARSFATDLLTHVEDDQRWGVSAAADPGAATGLKNGWLPSDDDGGGWIVNSVGVTTVAHDPVLLAVLTEHQPSEEAGIALVEALAEQAARAVVTGGGPPPGP